MQPDILVACDLEGNITEKGRYMGTPTLVVEILSNSTRSKDMVTKLSTYRLSGVQEYWIIDPKQESIMIYGFTDYEIDWVKTFEKGANAASKVFSGLSVNVETLFSDLLPTTLL
jgi:Uma2 family endonuclease